MTSVQSQQLYDRDFAQWIETTVACLKARDVSQLDWENLIEEIEELGRSGRRELKSRLGVLLIHLLKRCYVPMPENYRGWVSTIDEQRRELELLLEQSPSLRPYLLSEFDEVWSYALRQVRKDYPTSEFPASWPFIVDVKTLLVDEIW